MSQDAKFLLVKCLNHNSNIEHLDTYNQAPLSVIDEFMVQTLHIKNDTCAQSSLSCGLRYMVTQSGKDQYNI